MRLSFPKVFPFLVVALLLSAVVFHLTISNYAKSSLPPGCSPATADGEFVPGATVAFWDNHPLTPPLNISLRTPAENSAVLGANSADKWIEINLSTQQLTAHQGDQVFLTTLISSGLYDSTPVGEYRIWYKTASTLMTGGIKGQPSYYYLPNVPFSMFFFGSYGIHGTYWHHNFGYPMSHGCINTPTPMAEQLFYWADPQLPSGQRTVRSTAENPGTRVVIHK